MSKHRLQCHSTCDWWVRLAFRTTLVRDSWEAHPLLSHLYIPAEMDGRLCSRLLWMLIAHLSLLRILYHSRHIPQTLLQRFRELHRAGSAIAVKGWDWEDEAVFPHVVGASVTIWHHRSVPDDHVVLRSHLQVWSYLHLRGIVLLM